MNMLHKTPAQNMNTIWNALHEYRERCIPEYDPIFPDHDHIHDKEWDSICDAMWEVCEALGLPTGADAEEWLD